MTPFRFGDLNSLRVAITREEKVAGGTACREEIYKVPLDTLSPRSSLSFL